MNTIKVTKPHQNLQQQKSQTSLKNIAINKFYTNTNIKSPHETRTELDIEDDNNLTQT